MHQLELRGAIPKGVEAYSGRNDAALAAWSGGLSEPGDVTRMLQGWGKGDHGALDQLLPLVYTELRKLAAAKLAHEKPGPRGLPAVGGLEAGEL